MIQWDDIRMFLALAHAGTHKGAAKYLRVDQATVGRRIKVFEQALGTKLFDKRSDGFILTEAGNQLLMRAKDAELIIADMERGATALDQRPSGNIKLAMPGGMANFWLIPRLGAFFKHYPAISIDFLTGAEVVNLWKREADIAIRLVAPDQKELFHRRLGDLKLAFYISKKWQTSLSKKTDLAAYASIPFVGLTDTAMSEAERLLVHRSGLGRTVRCRSHAWTSVYAAISNHIGMGVLPSFYASFDKNLIEISSLPSAKSPIWLVMHPDVRGSGRVKVFAEFLATMVE